MQNSKFPRQGRAWEDVRDERLENRGGDLPWVAQRSFKPVNLFNCRIPA